MSAFFLDFVVCHAKCFLCHVASTYSNESAHLIHLYLLFIFAVGDIYLPVWGPITTSESRLVVTSDAMKEYDNEE